jgi:hypothetical protein
MSSRNTPEKVVDLTGKRIETSGFGSIFDGITDDFIQQPTPPTRAPLVPGFLPRGKPGILAGMGAGGKTTMTAELAFKMAYPMEGDTWMGQDIPEAEGKIVYVTREDSMEDIHFLAHDMGIQERQRVWRKKHGNEPRIKFITTEISQHIIECTREGGLGTTRFMDDLTERCIQWAPRLVVFDTASKTMRINLDTSSSETGGAADIMTNFSTATGSTSLVLHHVTKAGAKEIVSKAAFREAIKGSGSFVDGFRFALGVWQPWDAIIEAIVEAGIVDEDDAHLLHAMCLVKNNVRELRGPNLPHILKRGETIADGYSDITDKCIGRIEGFSKLLAGKMPPKAKPDKDDRPSRPASEPVVKRGRGRPRKDSA